MINEYNCDVFLSNIRRYQEIFIDTLPSYKTARAPSFEHLQTQRDKVQKLEE